MEGGERRKKDIQEQNEGTLEEMINSSLWKVLSKHSISF